MRCPVCLSSESFESWPHTAWRSFRFLHCAECDAVFVPEEHRVSAHQEKLRYETHKNEIGSPGFVEFLMRTVRVIQSKVQFGEEPLNRIRILDFGSGPEPTMSQLLREVGFEVVSYDPYFKPEAPQGLFSLILAHEVFEHLREPRKELDQIQKWLKPNGIFLIRSEFHQGQDAFSKWWYARDFTHILFPSTQTLERIARDRGWSFEFWSPTLAAFQATKSDRMIEVTSHRTK